MANKFLTKENKLFRQTDRQKTVSTDGQINENLLQVIIFVFFYKEKFNVSKLHINKFVIVFLNNTVNQKVFATNYNKIIIKINSILLYSVDLWNLMRIYAVQQQLLTYPPLSDSVFIAVYKRQSDIITSDMKVRAHRGRSLNTSKLEKIFFTYSSWFTEHLQKPNTGCEHR